LFYAKIEPDKKKFEPTVVTVHIEEQFGERDTAKREKFEDALEAYKLGIMIQGLRKERGMTQEQLAEKCGTTKTYISRIENNASDIRLSTLMRIIRNGLDGQLKLTVDMVVCAFLLFI
jgi:HTH-type transcriptional regulator/antitoxin HipB